MSNKIIAIEINETNEELINHMGLLLGPVNLNEAMWILLDIGGSHTRLVSKSALKAMIRSGQFVDILELKLEEMEE